MTRCDANVNKQRRDNVFVVFLHVGLRSAGDLPSSLGMEQVKPSELVVSHGSEAIIIGEWSGCSITESGKACVWRQPSPCAQA